MLDLLRPIYSKSAAYGHFGREEPEVYLGAHRQSSRIESSRRRVNFRI